MPSPFLQYYYTIFTASRSIIFKYFFAFLCGDHPRPRRPCASLAASNALKNAFCLSPSHLSTSPPPSFFAPFAAVWRRVIVEPSPPSYISRPFYGLPRPFAAACRAPLRVLRARVLPRLPFWRFVMPLFSTAVRRSRHLSTLTIKREFAPLRAVW